MSLIWTSVIIIVFGLILTGIVFSFAIKNFLRMFDARMDLPLDCPNKMLSGFFKNHLWCIFFISVSSLISLIGLILLIASFFLKLKS